MIIQGYFYSSILSFIKINDKFNSLSKNNRRILIQRNIHSLSGLNQLFIYDEIHFLNDPMEKKSSIRSIWFIISWEFIKDYWKNAFW
jgi:hypothetical protein